MIDQVGVALWVRRATPEAPAPPSPRAWRARCSPVQFAKQHPVHMQRQKRLFACVQLHVCASHTRATYAYGRYPTQNHVTLGGDISPGAPMFLPLPVCSARLPSSSPESSHSPSSLYPIITLACRSIIGTFKRARKIVFLPSFAFMHLYPAAADSRECLRRRESNMAQISTS